MTILQGEDLGVLENLGTALGFLDPTTGEPVADWIGDPGGYASRILADDEQRAALLAFVEETVAGGELTTEGDVTWLPIISVGAGDLTNLGSLDLSITVADNQTDAAGNPVVAVGVGARFSTENPASTTSISVPLFQVPTATTTPAGFSVLRIGTPGARIALSTDITVTTDSPVPGEAHIGGISVSIDLPTSTGDDNPVFGLTLRDLQLPGSSVVDDFALDLDSIDDLDDAIVEIVLALLRDQAAIVDAAGDPDGTGGPLIAVAGMLGLLDDGIDPLPIDDLLDRGVAAIGDWLTDLVAGAGRDPWLDHIASLVGGARNGERIEFDLDPATISLGLTVSTGNSGHTELTPTVELGVGTGTFRAEADIALCRVDLTTGDAVAVPRLGIWATTGTAADPVLDVVSPTAIRANTLRVGLAMDADRRLTAVLAADDVLIGSDVYPTLDLTSADAVMDAAGSTVDEIATALLDGLGDAADIIRILLGLESPPGHPTVPTVSIVSLLTDPLEALATYWRTLIDDHSVAMQGVLEEIRGFLVDTTVSGLAITGSGTPDDPWRLNLIGPVTLDVFILDGVLTIAVAVATRVDSLGQRCTVLETTLIATLAEIDFDQRSVDLFPAASAKLLARERGVNPPRIHLPLSEGAELSADHAGLVVSWSVANGLDISATAPNLTLDLEDELIPIPVPVIGPDGSVDLDATGWDAIQLLISAADGLLGGFVGDLTGLLGWNGGTDDQPILSLPDLMADPRAALTEWLPDLIIGDGGRLALSLLADLLSASGPNQAVLSGSGHPDDPYRIVLADDLPQPALWFPPSGLEPRPTAAPGAVRNWRPGDESISPETLQGALEAEASIDSTMADVVRGRNIATGFTALIDRWTGSDGRIAPPSGDLDGIQLLTLPVAAGGLLDTLDIELELDRIPTTTVFVAVGDNVSDTAADIWPDAPGDRLIDLTAAGLAPRMFTRPVAAPGEWFIALGGRSACRLMLGDDTDPSDPDGTVGQAQRLTQVLSSLTTQGDDPVVVAVAGAGHATRLALAADTDVTDLFLLGTPLGPVSLTALSQQPTADALRLLDQLLVAAPPTISDEDDDLALGRGLVRALLDLPTIDPGIDLRPPSDGAAIPAPSATGPTIRAVMGQTERDDVERAITAIVCSGLAGRATVRHEAGVESFTAAEAGLHLPINSSAGGSLRIEGEARLRLATVSSANGFQSTPQLRTRLWISDRLGWLAATPELDIRMFSVDATIDLGGTGPSAATIVLHNARVGSQQWERLVVGADGPVDAENPVEPLLPEARQLIDTVAQRLITEAEAGANSTANAMVDLATGLGLFDAGGAVNDGFDHFVRDPAALLKTALATDASNPGDPTGDAVTDPVNGLISGAVDSLLGSRSIAVDLAQGTVRFVGGRDELGLFGWNADMTATITGNTPSPVAIVGTITFGPDTPDDSDPAGGVQVRVDLDPLSVDVLWHKPDGATATTTETIALWPTPDPATLARTAAALAPGIAGQQLLELVRRTDDAVRPIIEAVLDALGLLTDAVTPDAERSVRPLFGLIAEPARWLRHSSSIGSDPSKAQAFLDAMRPLIGIDGTDGGPLVFGSGVSLSVVADPGLSGPGYRLDLAVDTSAFTADASAAGRIRGTVIAGLVVDPIRPSAVEISANLGVADDAVPSGTQAVHLILDRTGALSLFVRPSSGVDVSLVPFGGFGSVATAALAALPFLLDQLAGVAGPVGDAVGGVGDALGLRVPIGGSFNEAALTNWATNPADSLRDATPSILSFGLDSLSPILDPIVPIAISHDGATNELVATVNGFELRWDPNGGAVTFAATDIAVPGIETISTSLTISSDGLDHLLVTAGPAAIDIGGVVLKPFAVISAGLRPPDGNGMEIGLAVDANKRFGARWLFGDSFDLVTGSGPLDGLDTATDPVEVALCATQIVIELAASMALSTEAVQQLLDLPVGDGTDQVRHLLAGVLLEQTADPRALLDNVLDPDTLLDRALDLVNNIADVAPSVDVAGAGFTVALAKNSGVIGLQLGLAERFELLSGETMLWLETDDTWIDPDPAGDGGVFVGLVRVDGTNLSIEPSLAVFGVGLRVGALSGPLLDFGLTLESIALHTYVEVDETGLVGGGMQVEFTNLAVDTSGGTGGNPIAAGIMSDTGSQPPSPAFSPALAVQKRAATPAAVSLRAGEGAGPWWIGIQKGFGPLYVEQIGFGVAPPSGNIEQISVFFDGSVSMFGLQCAVDDLEITYLVRTGAGGEVNNPFDPASWNVDLAGLAVSADLAGITIAGGLLKSGEGNNVEYLGMLLARFGVYGITIYGGYGENDVLVNGTPTGERFVSFFAVGALVGPIGGVPAFFLTGIGGGFGINRELVIPSDLNEFGDYPLIKALDTGAKPGNPMEELRALGEHFPAAQDTFWFAAGISFTSFVIVSGIAVVAVEIGDGLDINLIGEAQLALPRPEVALVSIELALLVRFSSSEGVLWVQGQLTDNSYLLYRDVKLTGGFAYVMWFSGPNRGQFVITMGGYHPDFHRPDYPVVPRLGIEWKVSNNIHISAGGYFALTSEALMAGGDFLAAAEFGPAWAEIKFGAHAIVYFDPFYYKANAYARIAAGVTIDLWIFGEVTISISIGAEIEVEGPDFRGKAVFEVGPIELEVAFGDSTKHEDPLLSPSGFIDKYLDRAPSGKGIVFATVTTFGAAPPVTGAPTPDGQPDRPFIVTPEFGLIVTTVVPASSIEAEGDGAPPDQDFPATLDLGVAPMGEVSIEPVLRLSWLRAGSVQDFPFTVTARPFGAFPLGIWGPAKEEDNKALPKGEVVEALNELDLSARAELSEDDANPEIAFHRVEIGDRLPLPFKRRPAAEKAIRDSGLALSGLVDDVESVGETYDLATTFLAKTASPTALAAFAGERQAPPMFGTLGEGLEGFAGSVVPDLADTPPGPETDRAVHPAVAVALLPAAGPNEIGDPARAGARQRTTVTSAPNQRPWRRKPPTIAAVEADRSRSVATGLFLVEPPATTQFNVSSPNLTASGDSSNARRQPATVISTGDVPPSASGRGAPALVKTSGGEGNSTLRIFSDSLRMGRRRSRGKPGSLVGPGDVVVLRLPNARRDTDRSQERPALGFGANSAPVRIVAMNNSGEVIYDGTPAEGGWLIPRRTERLAVVGLGVPDDRRPLSATGLLGWHSGSRLAYLGRSKAVGPGCVVSTRGATIKGHRQRAGAGWLSGAELAKGDTTVTTRFDRAITSVVIAIDDPNTFGETEPARELIMNLTGATRATESNGSPRQPVVMTSENRSFVCYDIVAQSPDGNQTPVSVSVTSQAGWSLVAVLGGQDMSAKEAVALVAAKGLDAVTLPTAAGGTGTTRLHWIDAEQVDPALRHQNNETASEESS